MRRRLGCFFAHRRIRSLYFALRLLRLALRARRGLRCRIVRPCRLQRLWGTGEHAPHLIHRIHLLPREQVTISVHRERDGLVPHHLLYNLGVCAGHRQPRTAGVPQAMEVGDLTFMVHIGQEIALLPLGGGLRVREELSLPWCKFFR